MKRRHFAHPRPRNAARGFSLVELMISLILGLLVTAAAIGMFVSNSRTHNATENLSRLQENARIAFELMARDIREGSGNPCSNELEVTNRITNYATNWWSNWDRAVVSRGVTGYNNGALAGSLAGTDAIEILAGSSTGVMVTAHAPPNFTVNTTTHGLATGDILMVCDNRLISVFQAVVTGATINHGTAGTGAPGNSNANLGINNSAFTYNDNAMIVRLLATRWFVANNGRGGTSLFRLSLRGNATGGNEEVIEGVRDMELFYLLPNTTNYAATVAAARWDEVQAVRIRLNIITTDRVGTDGQPLSRWIEHTVNLRNRTL